MAQKILVVDRNEAFATMLKDMLETEGGYEVEVARTGGDALDILRRNDFDLTIVDMDLDPKDRTYRTLIGEVRQLQPAMRLMLIPLMGEDMPAEADRLGLQGTLSKPFFADDLLPRIREALTRQVAPPLPDRSAPVPPEPSPQITPIPSRAAAVPRPDIQAVLADLARETRADAILIVSTASGDERIVAHTTALERLDVAELASLCIATVQTAQSTSRVLGQPDEPFEHNMFESKTLQLHMVALPAGLLLVVVAPISTPLGTVRHNLRRASRDLTKGALT